MTESRETIREFVSEKPRGGVKAILVQPVHAWLTDTTAHGLARLVGQRPIYVKLLWLVGFALGLTGFVTQVQSFIETYQQQPATTTLKQNSVEFEFPDIVICNKAIMSGSYPYILGPSSLALLNNYVTQLTAQMGAPANQMQAAAFGKVLLATIPYKLLSEMLGHRLLQFLFLTNLNGLQMNAIPVKPFYSPSELNCFRLEPTPSQRQTLNTDGSYLEIGLFLDATFFDFPKTSSLLPIPVLNSSGISFLSWDFESGISLESANGVNLYFAKPGHYPDTDSMIQLSTGKDYRIDLAIERLTLSKGMQCSNNPDPSRIIDPYDNSVVDYQYSEYLCRAERSNQLMMQQSGCVSNILPRDEKFSNASYCFNASRIANGELTSVQFMGALYTEAYSSRALDQKAIQQYCINLKPCQTDTYTYSYSFGTWPRIFSSFQREILARFQELVRGKKAFFPGYPFPGYDDIENVANTLLNNLTTHNIVIGAGYIQDQVMRIRLFTGKSLGSGVQIEKSYDLTNLVADTGGLLGLYLGCSLLTMLEAAELLHDCLLACISAASSVIEGRRVKNKSSNLVGIESKITAAETRRKKLERSSRLQKEDPTNVSVTELDL